MLVYDEQLREKICEKKTQFLHRIRGRFSVKFNATVFRCCHSNRTYLSEKRTIECGCESVSESALRFNLIMVLFAMFPHTYTQARHNVILLVETICPTFKLSESEDKNDDEPR